ncbi:threonylcarbamoyl-AMP synthase, partial [bacterium]|nr:threonylcarbamoyl-AMP synthase [bacterium]
VRVVADGMLQMFLQKTGPLLTSSANLPGESPANTLEEARAYFRDAVDFYVDGGDLSGRQSSTLIRVVNGKVEVLRQGSIRV